MAPARCKEKNKFRKSEKNGRKINVKEIKYFCETVGSKFRKEEKEREKE